MSSRVRLAVLFGGRSSEHQISCISAGSVLAAIRRDRYDVVPIGITPQGRWALAPDDPAALTIREGRLPQVDESGPTVLLPPDPTSRRLVVLGGSAPTPFDEPIDVAFPLLHGPFGEDGTIQGLLEMAGIPYVGSGVLASAAAMDKDFMKLALAAHGLPQVRYVLVRRGQPVPADVAALGLPVFVKPARGGSSIGISKVDRPADLAAAVAHAHDHDSKVLIEEAAAGREIECGVLDGVAGGPPEASLPAEIRVQGRDFYDFAAKYLDPSTAFDVPAQLPEPTTARIRELAVRAFSALGCAGLARVDFFLRADGALLVNEVNTMPGFTPASMFPRMWEATGVDYPMLVDRLVQSALHPPAPAG